MRRGLLIHITIAGFLYGCSNLVSDSSILKCNDHNDVVLLLSIDDPKNITKINFTSDREVLGKTLMHDEFKEYKSIKYGFPASGEMTFRVKIYTSKDTLTEEFYAEKGYRIQLFYEQDTLRTLFGSTYGVEY